MVRDIKQAKVDHSSDSRAIMGSDLSPDLLDALVPEPDFAFAFNDINFSDRVLRIEIVPDISETKSDGEACTSIFDWVRNRKRRRAEKERMEKRRDEGEQKAVSYFSRRGSGSVSNNLDRWICKSPSYLL